MLSLAQFFCNEPVAFPGFSVVRMQTGRHFAAPDVSEAVRWELWFV